MKSRTHKQPKKRARFYAEIDPGIAKTFRMQARFDRRTLSAQTELAFLDYLKKSGFA